MLLSEYAVTPDVFDTTSYASDEVCGLYLQTIKEVLLTEGIVRDLRDGEWSRLLAGTGRPWHGRAKELLRKLATQQRLIRFEPLRAAAPGTDGEWCEEALETHLRRALYGVIVTARVPVASRANPVVATVDALTAAPWWQARSPSMRLTRTIAAYRVALDPLLRHANSLMFIDPHLDPSLHAYRDFVTLLVAAGGRAPAPLIELHRVCYAGSGVNRVVLTPVVLEAAFRQPLANALQVAGIAAEVFIWDDFHDRYVISDLMGILVPNGFDTTGAPNSQTTWSRLGRPERDDIQREFDPNAGRHVLLRRFRVP